MPSGLIFPQKLLAFHVKDSLLCSVSTQIREPNPLLDPVAQSKMFLGSGEKQGALSRMVLVSSPQVSMRSYWLIRVDAQHDLLGQRPSEIVPCAVCIT